MWNMPKHDSGQGDLWIVSRDLNNEQKKVMHMNTKRTASGFFIVEILIVLVIIGILTLALLPNLTTYAQRAKFLDNITSAEALKSAVEGCILQVGTVIGCDGGANGVPPDQAAAGSYVNSISAENGIITATSTELFGPDGDAPYTYVLTPTYANGVVTWSTTGSTCLAVGLC